MATGRNNKLVGQIGEFLVCAELGRRGFIATPFSGNVPGFDVIATDERFRSFPIQVKTISTGDWPTTATKHMLIDYDATTGRQRVTGKVPVPDPDTIMVFVRLRADDDGRDRFFILTRQEFQDFVHGRYTTFLAKHDGRRPQKQDSLAVRIRIHELESYENRWDLIEQRLATES